MRHWQERLAEVLRKHGGEVATPGEEAPLRTRNVAAFHQEAVIPAFEELKNELTQHGRSVAYNTDGERALLEVHYQGRQELAYRVHIKASGDGVQPYVATDFRAGETRRSHTGEEVIRPGSQDYTVADVTKDDIIRHFLDAYEVRLSRQP